MIDFGIFVIMVTVAGLIIVNVNWDKNKKDDDQR
jgi:hypothetical protein